MGVIEDAVHRLRQCARPVLFETGIEDTPYSGMGTCFLAKVGPQLFVVTARHVLEGCSLDDLLIFPNEETADSIPFSAGFSVKNPDLLEPDYSDVVVMKVDLSGLRLSEKSLMHAMDLDKASDDWRKGPYEHRFAIFGYPNDSRKVDYDRFTISSTGRLLLARFSGTSSAAFCFELAIEDFGGVDDLNGLSGSPVVSWPRIATDHFHPSFCGIALRGTKTSGKIRFLDAKVVRRILDLTRDT
jgi:hypothetical protein